MEDGEWKTENGPGPACSQPREAVIFAGAKGAGSTRGLTFNC